MPAARAWAKCTFAVERRSERFKSTLLQDWRVTGFFSVAAPTVPPGG